MGKKMNLKVAIRNREHSREVQEYLFKLGYSWGNTKAFRHTDRPYIYAIDTGMLACGSDPKTFDMFGGAYATLEVLREMVDAKKSFFKKGDVVRVISTKETQRRYGYIANMLREGQKGTVNCTVEDDLNRLAVEIGDYLYAVEDLEIVHEGGESPEQQTLEELIAENKGLMKQITKLRERLARKENFYKQNAEEIKRRIEGAV